MQGSLQEIVNAPSTTRPSPTQDSQPTSVSCFSGGYLRTSVIGTQPVYMVIPIGVTFGPSSSSVTTGRTMLRWPSAPMMTSAWRISPVLSLTVGRNVCELGPGIEVLVVPFSGRSSSRAGSTDWTVTPKCTRAPADEARRRRISSRSACCPSWNLVSTGGACRQQIGLTCIM